MSLRLIKGGDEWPDPMHGTFAAAQKCKCARCGMSYIGHPVVPLCAVCKPKALEWLAENFRSMRRGS